MNVVSEKRIAVVTGGAGSLGRAVAQHLHEAGFYIALVDRQAVALHEAVQALQLDGVHGQADAVELTVKSEVDGYIAKLSTEQGRISVLVNVAGAFAMSHPTQNGDEAVWDSMMTVNAKTAFLMSAAVARAMVGAQTPGRIINIAARAALSGGAGIAAYSASKAALLRLTESMAAELLPHRITVNAILPSTLDTPANRHTMPDADFNAWVTPASLAEVIAFLASDAARDISGAALPVYGRA